MSSLMSLAGAIRADTQLMKNKLLQVGVVYMLIKNVFIFDIA